MCTLPETLPRAAAPPPDPTPAFISTFTSSTPSQRQHLLTSLTQHLLPSEWHHIHTLLTTRTYFLDILAHLPLDLSTMILEHLSPPEHLPLRFVSHRWAALTRTPTLCASLTRLHYPLSFTTAPPSPNWYHILTKAQSLEHRLITHSPHGRTTLPLPPGDPSLLGAAGHLLILSHEGLTITILHLPTRTYTLRNVPILTRETPRANAMCMSTTHLFIAGWSAVVCVYPLDVDAASSPPYTFRLPSIPITPCAADGGWFVAVFAESVVVHNTRDRTTREIPWAAPARLWRAAVVDAEAEEYTLFTASGRRLVEVWRFCLRTGESRGVGRVEGFDIALDDAAAPGGLGLFRNACMAPGVHRVLTIQDDEVLVMVWWDVARRRSFVQRVGLGGLGGVRVAAVWSVRGVLAVWAWMGIGGEGRCWMLKMGEDPEGGEVRLEEGREVTVGVPPAVGVGVGRAWWVMMDKVWEWRGVGEGEVVGGEVMPLERE